MVNPETSEIAIARRLLGMAARLGHSCIPEEIANEATSALYELSEARGEGNVRFRAMGLAQVLIRYATLRDAGFSLERSAANLSAAIAHEELHCAEREAA